MIKLDDASSVDDVDAVALNIVSVDGGIAVLGVEGETVEVYSMLGTLVSKTVATGYITTIQLQNGAYVVRFGTDTYKVFVR